MDCVGKTKWLYCSVWKALQNGIKAALHSVPSAPCAYTPILVVELQSTAGLWTKQNVKKLTSCLDGFNCFNLSQDGWKSGKGEKINSCRMPISPHE